MQNKDSQLIDLEFEISGEKIGDFDWSEFEFSSSNNFKIAKIVHGIILKKAWELASLEGLRNEIEKKVDFVDLVKIKLDFSEKEKINKDCLISYVDCEIEFTPHPLSNELFVWIYYNENEKLQTFRFILDISTGEIKFLNN